MALRAGTPDLFGGNPRRSCVLLVLRAAWEIVLQSHPLSSVPARILKHPQEAEVVGQVVGVAMRLGEWYAPDEREQRQNPEADVSEPKELRRR